MSGLSTFLSYCLIAVFVCNTVFYTGAGSEELIKSRDHWKHILLLGGLVSLYSFLATLLTAGVCALVPDVGNYIIVYGAVLCLAVLFFYFLFSRIALRSETLRDRVGAFLAPCAVNGAVIALPLAAFFALPLELPYTLGMAAGSGIGYIAAAFLLRSARRVTESPRVPKAFRGAPATLLFIGVVSLALSVMNV